MRWTLLVMFMYNIFLNASAQKMNIPEDYVWKNRIILLFAPDNDHSLSQQQIAELESDEDGVTERDLITFQILPDQVTGGKNIQNTEFAQSLRSRYGVNKVEFCAILIGKDGSEKLRKNTVITREELYGVIDAMPMRQREVREREDED